MLTYVEGRLLAVSKEGFTDNEGQKVEYHVNVIKASDGLMTVNSKKDYSEHEGKEAIFALRLTEDAEKKNRFKVSITDVKVGETLGFPESEIG